MFTARFRGTLKNLQYDSQGRRWVMTFFSPYNSPGLRRVGTPGASFSDAPPGWGGICLRSRPHAVTFTRALRGHRRAAAPVAHPPRPCSSPMEYTFSLDKFRPLL